MWYKKCNKTSKSLLPSIDEHHSTLLFWGEPCSVHVLYMYVCICNIYMYIYVYIHPVCIYMYIYVHVSNVNNAHLGYSDVLGESPDNWMGTCFYDLLHPKDIQKVKGQLACFDVEEGN